MTEEEDVGMDSLNVKQQLSDGSVDGSTSDWDTSEASKVVHGANPKRRRCGDRAASGDQTKVDNPNQPYKKTSIGYMQTIVSSTKDDGRLFAEKHKFKKQVRLMHEKIREYECHLCHKNFSSLNSVHTHTRTMRINLHIRAVPDKTHFPKEFCCTLCDAVFKRKETYESHVMEHEHGKRNVHQDDELVKQRKGHEGRHFVVAAFQMLVGPSNVLMNSS
ncbi:hypothetical protein pipiens_005439 [Culex pipiens pipiens]|uniref:C2H2-type domain-containing protein n=1 Tax=Culex pipiens pipiens TaxID=38569 RepID=A0ABD1DWS6_CULPP